MKVKIVKELCIGAANCVAVAPEAFALDENNKAYVKKGDQKIQDEWVDIKELGVTEEQILIAAQSCPTQAIIVADDSGKQIWPQIN